MSWWTRFLERGAVEGWHREFGPDLLFLTGTGLRELQWLVGRLSTPPLSVDQIRSKTPEQLESLLSHRRDRFVEVLERHEERREMIVVAIDLVTRFGVRILPLLFGL